MAATVYWCDHHTAYCGVVKISNIFQLLVYLYKQAILSRSDNKRQTSEISLSTREIIFIFTSIHLLFCLSRLQTSKFSMTSFHMTSFISQVHVSICNIFYMTSFHMTSYTLLVWTCQQVYFDEPLANRTDQMLRLLWQVFFVDPYRRAKFVLWQFFLWQVHLFKFTCAYRRANKTCHIKTCHRKLARL